MADNKKSSIGGKSTCHLLNIKQADRAKKRIKLSFRRTSATLNLLKTDKLVEASLGLIDISETGAGLFTRELLAKGSAVEVCITEPRLLKVKGLVAWSVPVASGVQGGKFKFRSGMQFVFENEVQRTAVIEFIQSVNTDPLENMRMHPPGEPVPASGLAPEGGPSVAFIDQGNTAESTPAPEAAAGNAAPAPGTEGAPAAPIENAAAPAPSAEAPKAEAPKAEEAPAAATEEPKAA